MKTVMFICTANYYRSRFAEAWFNAKKGPNLKNWRAISRGLMIDCAPSDISCHTLDAIERNGIPDECYQKKPIALDYTDFLSVDLAIALKREEHYSMVKKQFPDWADKVRYWDVHDLDVWKPNQTLPAIEIQVGLLIAELGFQSRV